MLLSSSKGPVNSSPVGARALMPFTGDTWSQAAFDVDSPNLPPSAGQ